LCVSRKRPMSLPKESFFTRLKVSSERSLNCNNEERLFGILSKFGR
jgi:hypothetical protein